MTGCVNWALKTHIVNIIDDDKWTTKEWKLDILKPGAVIGTNARGGKLYGKAIRRNYVEDTVIKDAMQMAQFCDIPIYDLARDYGFVKLKK